MSRTRIAAHIVFTIALAATAVAHEAARAQLTVEPDRPRVGAACRVVVVAPETSALGRLSRRVWLSADMPMHVMRPVEAELRRTDDPNVYTGDIAFTMPGPWRVELRVQEVDETMRGAFEMRVLREDEANEARAGQHVIELEDMARPTVFPPQLVLGGAVALTLLLQIAAILVARRRTKAAASADRHP
jgi:hypothetical protein